MKKKIVYIMIGGAVMILGDYLVSYFDSVTMFITGEVVSLSGWSMFVLALDN